MATEAFHAAVIADTATPHTEVFVRDVRNGFNIPLEIITGRIEIDRTQQIRRSCQLELVDATGTLTPRTATDLLAAFGNEVHIWEGFRYSDGVIETIPVGVYRIEQPRVHDSRGNLKITLGGSDRAVNLQRSRLTDTLVIADGTPVADAIATIATQQYPAVVLNLPSMEATTPRVVYTTGQDAWAAILDIGEQAGFEVFFNPNGELTAEVPSSLDDPPEFTYQGGSEARLLTLERDQSTGADVYNGVIVQAEGTSLASTIRAEVWDEDPSSPMYSGFPDALGATPFGAVPDVYIDRLVRTQGQAQAAAQGRFDRRAGAVEQVQWSQLSDPSLAANDVIRVLQPMAGLDEMVVVLDKIRLTVGSDEPLEAYGRRRFL